MAAVIDDINSVPFRLRSIRRSFGIETGVPTITQADFSRHLGATPAYYSEYESGTSEPTIDLLAAIRERTGLSLDWLVSGVA